MDFALLNAMKLWKEQQSFPNDATRPVAIALYFKEITAGYIPKEKNQVIARLIDAGKAFYATIQAKEWEGNWLMLDVKLYMKH